jgi:hypothetical protein
MNTPYMGAQEEAVAQEKGRRLAAARMAEYHDIRQRLEDVYGVAYCKSRYPEAYLTVSEADKKLASLPVVLL